MMYLPRICNHCANPSCVASCPSGALYKRGEDGIVLVDQQTCRGWRACVVACPYKKVYYNWKTGKSEKCILCYPRLETGQPPACFHSCVGRIRYMGVLLYDASRLEEAAKAPREALVEAQRSLILDPRDPEVVRAAERGGVSPEMIDAARRSPVYKFVVDWKLALPLHPEFRTLPMLFYVPPLLPVMGRSGDGIYEHVTSRSGDGGEGRERPVRAGRPRARADHLPRRALRRRQRGRGQGGAAPPARGALPHADPGPRRAPRRRLAGPGEAGAAGGRHHRRRRRGDLPAHRAGDARGALRAAPAAARGGTRRGEGGGRWPRSVAANAASAPRKRRGAGADGAAAIERAHERPTASPRAARTGPRPPGGRRLRGPVRLPPARALRHRPRRTPRDGSWRPAGRRRGGPRRLRARGRPPPVRGARGPLHPHLRPHARVRALPLGPPVRPGELPPGAAHDRARGGLPEGRLRPGERAAGPRGRGARGGGGLPGRGVAGAGGEGPGPAARPDGRGPGRRPTAARTRTATWSRRRAGSWAWTRCRPRRRPSLTGAGSESPEEPHDPSEPDRPPPLRRPALRRPRRPGGGVDRPLPPRPVQLLGPLLAAPREPAAALGIGAVPPRGSWSCSSGTWCRSWRLGSGAS